MYTACHKPPYGPRTLCVVKQTTKKSRYTVNWARCGIMLPCDLWICLLPMSKQMKINDVLALFVVFCADCAPQILIITSVFVLLSFAFTAIWAKEFRTAETADGGPSPRSSRVGERCTDLSGCWLKSIKCWSLSLAASWQRLTGGLAPSQSWRPCLNQHQEPNYRRWVSPYVNTCAPCWFFTQTRKTELKLN